MVKDNSTLLLIVLNFCNERGVAPGKHRLQKTIYLLQARGLVAPEDAYHYGFYLYGVFSEDLADDVSSLLNDKDAYAVAELGDGVVLKRDRGFEMRPATADQADALRQYLGYEGKYLEVLSTVHFVAKVEKHTLESLAQRVLAVKPKYDEASVQRAITELATKGLLGRLRSEMAGGEASA